MYFLQYKYHKDSQISRTFFPKISFNNVGAAYLQDHLEKVLKISVNRQFCEKKKYRNKYYINYSRVLVIDFASFAAPKKTVISSVHLLPLTLLCNRSFKRCMVVFLEQKNVTRHRIFIPLLSCLQC